MGKKSKRNRDVSKKQKSARRVHEQGGVTNTSATSDAAAAVIGHEIEPSSTSATCSIRRDPMDSLVELLTKKDYEGILQLESDVILRATVLEGIEPQKASVIYLVVANAFIVTGL